METIHAEMRKKGSTGRLRRSGKIPGVLYGKAMPSVPVAVEEKELLERLKHSSRLALLELSGYDNQSVMMTEIQQDPISRRILHFDLVHIEMNQKINTQVRLDYTGDAEGVRMGGILQVQVHELDIRCLPDKIPASLKVDISRLGVGEHFLASDIKLPEGVELKAEPDDVLVTVLTVQKESPVADAASETGPESEETARAEKETAQ